MYLIRSERKESKLQLNLRSVQLKGMFWGKKKKEMERKEDIKVISVPEVFFSSLRYIYFLK